jgi:hypothetical protein
MKKTLFVTVILVMLASSAALQGCGGSPAGTAVGTFLRNLKDGNDKAAQAGCYDKISSQELADELSGSIYAADIKVVSSTEPTSVKVRKQGVEVARVQSAEERTASQVAGTDARYKPQIDAAASAFKDSQTELAAAQAQLAYCRVTWAGQGASEIYKAENWVASVRPRVSRAQSKLDILNSQHQAELQAVKAAAEAQYKAEMVAHEKELADKLVALPVSRVRVMLSGAKGNPNWTFTAVHEREAWKVLSASRE